MMGETKKVSQVAGVIQFLNDDIWRIRASKLPKSKSLWIRQLRIILLSISGFNEDNCQLRASALTFFTLLSVVPMAAMAFGIAKGFGFEQMLAKQMLENFPGQQEVVQEIITFAHSFLENTKGGVIAGVGVAVLFWTVIKVLGNIENSFNDIWGIKRGRPLARKFSDYISMMLVCPVLFIMSSSVTVLITSQVTMVMEKLSFLGPVSTMILYLLGFLPYVVTWVLFTFVYIFMPNTKVNFTAGLMGGVIGGTIYQLAQWVYITFQVGVAKFGAIYGSFAALPLFLVWLQTSWMIVLFGAEISFAEQNVDTYEFEPDCLKASPAFKRLAALRVMHLCVKNFDQNRPAWTAEQIAHELELPVRLLNQTLFDLTEVGLLTEVRMDSAKAPAYQPGRNIAQMTLNDVITALDHKGIRSIPVADSPELGKLASSLEAFHKTIAQSPDNLLLKEI